MLRSWLAAVLTMVAVTACGGGMQPLDAPSDRNHAYYLPSGQSGAGMNAFYLSVMNGVPYDLETGPGIASRTTRDGARVVVFDGT